MNSHIDSTFIRDSIPLISNLNILENIAIIKEVHKNKTIKKAEDEALELLKRISLEDIADKRITQCNEFEIFCAMLIRAMMNEKKHIIIVTPFSLITALLDMKEITDIIDILDIKKDIIIVDMQNNRTNYEGDLCHIVE